MDVFGIIAIAIVFAILIRTGSVGKAFSFFMSYLFLPIIFCILGGLLMYALSMSIILGCIIGFIVGLVLAFKKGSDNLK